MAYEQVKRVEFMNSDTNMQHNFLQLSHSLCFFSKMGKVSVVQPLYMSKFSFQICLHEYHTTLQLEEEMIDYVVICALSSHLCNDSHYQCRVR